MILLFLLLLTPFSIYPFFDAYKAAQAYKSGDFQQAQELYKEQLIENVNDGATLFNSGDSSYRLGELETAHAYFSKAAEQLADEDPLKVRAYFNACTVSFKKEQ